MTTLYLARHGETVDNFAKTFQGQRQGKLTPTGVAQMEGLAASLSGTHFDAIVSSDLRRAHDSALILARKLNMNVRTTVLLRERDWGDFTGRFIPDLEGLPLPDNVEDMDHMMSRATKFLEWIKANYPGKTVLAVGHGIINKAIMAVHSGKPPHDILDMSNAEYQILKLNKITIS